MIKKKGGGIMTKCSANTELKAIKDLVEKSILEKSTA